MNKRKAKRIKKQKKQCPSGKVRYYSWGGAKFFQQWELPGGRVYRCNLCGYFHVTSAKRRRVSA